MASGTPEEVGPDVDWLMAQPYESWGEVRRSECPVLATHGDVMGPGTGTFYQVARFKDADSVLRDDKTFSSSINADHIGQFMGDFISDLVHTEVDGERLSDDKIYGFLRLLLPAGGETTFRVMGNALLALLTHPDALAKVYVDCDLIPEVIEETLRWESSVTMVSRVATVDTEVSGCPIASGSPVGVLTGSANRDETRWDDASEWELGRPVQHHLAFGTGP